MFQMERLLLLIVLNAYHGNAVTPSMSILEMIRSYGYPAEEYKRIKTEDGYLLTMHRIPYGVHNREHGNRPIVFLMHGLLSSSYDWVNMGPGHSIAYDLAEAGYDVWMGNAKGNKFSRRHVRLHPVLNRRRFWSFSWHEIGFYDLPAMIDYILKKTGRRKLSYIGHSQGTTSFFVMASTRPAYNKKIRLMVALAPVVYMNHMANPLLRMMSKLQDPFKWAMNFLGWYEFLPGSNLFNLIGVAACQGFAINAFICTNAFFMICGWDSQQLNRSTIPVIAANVPAGAASRQFMHYAQGMRSGRFREYDFGRLGNLVKYHATIPPDYDLNKVTAPISLIYANNDWLSSIRDVERLYNKLSNVVDIYKVPFQRFNHLDYLFAIDVKRLVNDHVLATLYKFNEDLL